LAAAHNPPTKRGDYLRDSTPTVHDFAALGTELSREPRGAAEWYRLQVRGTDYLRDVLDERLDMAQEVATTLADDPRIEVPFSPTLTVVLFRLRAGDQATEVLSGQLRSSGRLWVATTVYKGRVYVRMCLLSHYLRREHGRVV